MPVVYLLRNEAGRTYVGSTVAGVAHRLRQHNGELVGGAAQTARGRPWSVDCVVSGFRCRREALQFEFAWRRAHRACRPRPPYTATGRRRALAVLMARDRWSRNAPLACEVPLVVSDAEPRGPVGGSQTS